MSNGSGDYVIAFSTVPVASPGEWLSNDEMSPLFQAVAEATEESVYNALFTAQTVESRFGTAEALPLDRTLTVLTRYNALHWNRTLLPNAGE